MLNQVLETQVTEQKTPSIESNEENKKIKNEDKKNLGVSSMGARTYSSPHLLISKPLQNLVNANSSYYIGLFEFPQGSEPRIIWDLPTTAVMDLHQFLLYVVNFPTDLRLAFYRPRPTVIKSEYMGTHFIAIYVSIPDAEARGFSRSIVLVLGNKHQTIMQYIYANLLDKFMSYAVSLQDAAAEIFPKEISVYAASLNKVLKTEPNSVKLLESKLDELENTLRKVEVEAAPESEAIPRDPYFFVEICNELRPIRQLTKFDDIIPSLTSFVQSLPSDITLTNAIWKSSTGISGLLSNAMTGDCKKFNEIVKSKVIYNCLFTLFSGHSLYVLSSSSSEYTSVAKKIAALCPYGVQFPVVEIANRTKITQIIVGLDYDHQKDPFSSFLFLDSMKFEGYITPPDSILLKDKPAIENHTSPVIVMLLYTQIKKIYNRFVRKAVEMSSRSQQTLARMNTQMLSVGFSPSDSPIIRNWAIIADANANITSTSINCFL